MYIAGDTFF